MSFDRPNASELQKTLRRRGLPVRQERLNVIRSSALPGIEILIAYDSFHPWRIYNSTYALCACRTAATDWRYRRRVHTLQDGGTMLLQAGEAHANTYVHKYSDFKALFIEPALVQQAAHELASPKSCHFKAAQTEDPALFAAVYALGAAIESGADALEQQSRLALCLRLMFGYMEAQQARPPINASAAVRHAEEYLRQRFHETVTLDELVTISGLSRFHLLRSFAAHAGLPPHAYQIRLRIAHAMQLLRSGLAPGTVAVLVGFADQSHLTRHFRRVMRMTPGQYMPRPHRPQAARNT